MVNHLILGSGSSAYGCATLLRAKGLAVCVSDLNPLSQKSQTAFESLGCKIIIGPQDSELLEPYDPIVVSPGIPLDSPVCLEAKTQGKTLISEVDLALLFFKGESIGITGTNGKSTVVTLFEHICRKLALDCQAGGNLGKTPSEIVAAGSPDILALELSSYQLELTKNLACKASIFTSFSPDHLARHKTMESYISAKWNLADQTIKGGTVVLSESFLEGLIHYKLALPAKRNIIAVITDENLKELNGIDTAIFNSDKNILIYRGKQIKLIKDFSFHDNLNLAYCLIALEQFDKNLNYKDVVDSAKDYRKLPHRFEIIGYSRKMPIINDSKSTNLESSMAALKSMKKPCYLLLGGQGKGDRYQIVSQQKETIKKLYCFGASANEIFQDLNTELNANKFESLNEALIQLAKDFKSNPLPILFSPACASFDEFLNFEERGLYFKKVLLKLLE